MNKSTVQLMRRRWQGFAREDPMYYVATRTQPWSAEAFFASGRALVEDVMHWIGPETLRGRMLDLGCGLGRTAVHFAGRFRDVCAVDISPAMIEQAMGFNPPKNVQFVVNSGGDLGEFHSGSFDMIASFFVFQHVDDECVVHNYLAEISRVMTPAGRAVLQFDTRPRSMLLDVYKLLPDAVLPRVHRRGIRRHRRDPQRLRSMFRDAELQVIDERGAATAEHMFLLAADRGARS